MNNPTPRKTFGLKPSPRSSRPASSKSTEAKAADKGLNPIVLGGAGAFAVALAAMYLLDGSPAVQPGATPMITEIQGGQTGAPRPTGGKFGAATDAVSNANR